MKALVVLTLVCLLAGGASARTLRIAADPNNLPFSNDREEGFENALASMLARDLGAGIEYVWRAQRRGFFRESFQGDRCDLVLGAPVGFERAHVTAPYYRSSYVFVTRDGLAIASLDDPRLKTLRVGIAVVGDDGADPPTTLALARRGIVDNVTGFSVYGDYREPSPPLRLLDALDRGQIDVALGWGPVAGAAAHARPGAYRITPVTPDPDPLTGMPFSFAIGIGVRKDEPALAREIESFLARRRPDIERLLDAHGIPRTAP